VVVKWDSSTCRSADRAPGAVSRTKEVVDMQEGDT
jgi:hypothetical protein